jgi:hypothetical protein
MGEDEWYFVRMCLFIKDSLGVDTKFYKCDQIDGLIKLLKDKGITPIERRKN